MFGGSSDERLVSVASAQNLSANFEFDERWFVTELGRVIKVTTQELAAHQNPFKNAFAPATSPFASSIAQAIGTLKNETVFLGFHGTEGEDGKIQALLERAKIPFTGSGSVSSHNSFDKTIAKKAVGAEGITMAAQLLINGGDAPDALTSFYKTHGKIVVKPVANGSSFGLHIVSDDKTLAAALVDIRRTHGASFLAEKFVKGRELTITVIDKNGESIALPPSEVVLNEGHSFDYDGKYLGKGTTEITPADLTEAEKARAQHLAVQAHKILKCYGYSRTDAILTSNGITYLETNSLPGLTRASFVPQQLKVAGLSMTEFIELQLNAAQKRYS